ncbi:glycosyltransferase family 4 protein [Paenibacillus sp. MBLB4367]|uniref:glycosyltransferase family 4 protein n=1 Tax=Paenibacillus sp. MBLB4367 TaxID=3384767 RepID=UPI003908009C
MNLLIIAPWQNSVPPIVGSSVENCIYQISKKLALKHKVTVLSRKTKRYPSSSREGNLTILRFSAAGASGYLSAALNHVKGRHFDMIQIDNRPGYAPKVRAFFPNANISVFLHSLTFVSSPMTSRSKALRDLTHANLIVGNSRSLRSNLRAMFPSLAARVRYVHLGANLQQFQPPTAGQKAALRKKYGVSKRFTVVFAGRLIPRKGIPVLIKAAKIAKRSIPSIKLVIAGGTEKASYKGHLKQLAARQGVSARFLGYVTRKRMHEVYRIGDCMVCPSQKHEAFGLVIVESMACGVPTVASRIGGIPEIIRNGENGLLVSDFRNPHAFAKAIVNVHKHKSFARKLSQKARHDAVNKFGWSATASRLESIYRNKG